MMEPGNFYYTYAFMAGYGGYIFGNDNTNPEEIGINSEGAIKSGELMKKFIASYSSKEGRYYW